jgi:hypothetical protein
MAKPSLDEVAAFEAGLEEWAREHVGRERAALEFMVQRCEAVIAKLEAEDKGKRAYAPLVPVRGLQ